MSARWSAGWLAMALLASPAAAAPSVFWSFGFYFPEKEHHRAGGFAAMDRAVKEVRLSSIDVRTAAVALPISAGEPSAAAPSIAADAQMLTVR